MRVMLFQNGERGKMVELPGEHPLAEIEELIGGPAEPQIQRISRRIGLVIRRDWQEKGLPGRYTVDRLGLPEMLVAGDCVAVRWAPQDGRIYDMNATDAAEAQGYLCPMEVAV